MLSQLIRLAAALAAVFALASCASDKTIGATFDDIGAAASLKSVLVADRKHDYSDVDVTIFEGRLLLTGTMQSEEGRRTLAENAWKADNITQVIDEVVVADSTTFGQGLEDSRIDQAIKAKLIGDRGVTSGNYKIAVSRGVVYLLGVARDKIELDRVLHSARTTAGVEKVVSHVLYRDDPARNVRR
ncbi:MAG: BON domain-containing protein [Parvularculaceae bacterium]